MESIPDRSGYGAVFYFCLEDVQTYFGVLSLLVDLDSSSTDATPLSRGLRIETENFDVLQGQDGFFTNTVYEKCSCRATALVRAYYRYYVDHGCLSGAFALGDSSSKRNHGQQELGVILAVCISRVQA
jgi:hypothetical protein